MSGIDGEWRELGTLKGHGVTVKVETDIPQAMLSDGEIKAIHIVTERGPEHIRGTKKASFQLLVNNAALELKAAQKYDQIADSVPADIYERYPKPFRTLNLIHKGLTTPDGYYNTAQISKEYRQKGEDPKAPVARAAEYVCAVAVGVSLNHPDNYTVKGWLPGGHAHWVAGGQTETVAQALNSAAEFGVSQAEIEQIAAETASYGLKGLSLSDIERARRIDRDTKNHAKDMGEKAVSRSRIAQTT